MTDGSGPYIRFEVTIAAAIVKRDDTILNDDMLDTTLVFGRPLADGPAIDAGLVPTERSQAAIASCSRTSLGRCRCSSVRTTPFSGSWRARAAG